MAVINVKWFNWTDALPVDTGLWFHFLNRASVVAFFILDIDIYNNWAI